MKTHLSLLAALLSVGGCTSSADPSTPPRAAKPNFIVIFADDLGYGDLSCYGAPKIRTPRLDRMAREGMRFTNFYAQTVCGPSRAALMTGCYPLRVAKRGNSVTVHPYLHGREKTIAEVLKEAGYTSGCFGKWDLAGHTQVNYDPNLLPTRQGFDYFFGTPTSNDRFVNLLRNETVIERKANMNTLTKRYTDEAIGFIRRNSDRPFFVYLPHTMPHTLLGASTDFRGRSKQGLYGDVIEEIDSSAGRILDAVKKFGLDRNTYVIFTSDNGPWWIKKAHGGSAAPLRGAKTSTWEGGLRVPFIIRAPGRVPAGTICDEIASTMDLLPTFAGLSGAKAPVDRIIDGRDIAELLHGYRREFAEPRSYFYFQHTHLQAVRQGPWKLHLPRPANPKWTPNWARHIDGKDVFDIETPLLFNLDQDIGEKKNLASTHPNIVRQLQALATRASADIGDYNQVGSGARFFDPEPKRPDIK